MSLWAEVRSFGCFGYFEREPREAARALIDALMADLALERELQISTAGRWRKFARKAVDDAIAKPSVELIALLIGTSTDVRLGGHIDLHIRGSTEFRCPPMAWFGAESQRWPETMFVAAARRWLQLAAEHATPLSGGVLAATDLRNAKVEMTQVFETYPDENPDRSPTSFRGRLEKERPLHHTRTQIRRVYPITLLGPKFASQIDVGALRDAGATNLTTVNGSVIFDAAPALVEAWDPTYLAATPALRRLLWPLSMQHPMDDPDAKPTPSRR